MCSRLQLKRQASPLLLRLKLLLLLLLLCS
jgi:hypothetical protein